MEKFKKVLKLFLIMFKIGLFTFGGGYAMIAVLEREFVERQKWLADEEFLNIAGIAESTPGPIAINSATYIGYKIAGFFGSLFATLGVVLPSFIIIFAISFVFDWFSSLEYVTYAFRGIQACVAFLIFSAGLKMFSKLKKNPFNLILYLITLISFTLLALFGSQFSAVFYVLIGGGIGVIVYLIGLLVARKKKKNTPKDNAGEGGNE
ncbi:MAG: chromate transporter [Clostridia bacterium]|nr:chromate transporter [Clostridia bacterium]